MNVQVRLFASFAETYGWRHKTLTVAEDTSALAAWTGATGDAALPARALCAINLTYCPADTALREGDEVAFFPPVTGG